MRQDGNSGIEPVQSWVPGKGSQMKRLTWGAHERAISSSSSSLCPLRRVRNLHVRTRSVNEYTLTSATPALLPGILRKPIHLYRASWQFRSVIGNRRKCDRDVAQAVGVRVGRLRIGRSENPGSTARPDNRVQRLVSRRQLSHD